MNFYILTENNEPKKVDVLEWAKWFHTSDRSVRFTIIKRTDTGDLVEISTVFLGLSHNHLGGPYLYEQLIAYHDGEKDVIKVQSLGSAKKSHQDLIDIYLDNGDVVDVDTKSPRFYEK